ncbi:hypothetical protein LQ567_09370 [Niabella pedocola]|uniref:Uncharacterized protein n=1 Tax=Niabella pedocola TaxID=1752077 RepID=A0ABS8PPD6_9BACT|nr:hypothetical protein [Niabella pedocola]MCD2422970.1 hypothetical protein [Niabella pedocola]
MSDPTQNNSPAAIATEAGPGYRFVIPNARVLIYQVFAYGIIFLNMLGQLLMDYQRNSPNLKISVLVCVLLFVMFIFRDVYLLRKKNALQSLGIVILILGFRWYQYALGWGFAINVLLWFLYLVARRQLVINITVEEIRYPSFPVKKIAWNEISNLVLKADILTIDLKNNKIYQHFIKDADQIVSETIFNEFCRKQLAAHSR